VHSRPAHYFDPYDRLAPFYDPMARAILLPFGGERLFRRRALAPLAIGPGTRVLELGCGTGSMTAELLRAGAEVTAVDLSAPMLARARRRARGATFRMADILAFDGRGAFDVALLAFVLHEMEAPVRRGALAAARRALAPGGRVAVVDFAPPASRLVRAALEAYLRIAEPAQALELLRLGGPAAALSAAGFPPRERRLLALGTIEVAVASPAPEGPPGRALAAS
jgi:demethylmenaquinone methyltransferase/2-methoxy-6-polyprenyl-1,4-benzoquinol methylase